MIKRPTIHPASDQTSEQWLRKGLTEPVLAGFSDKSGRVRKAKAVIEPGSSFRSWRSNWEAPRVGHG